MNDAKMDEACRLLFSEDDAPKLYRGWNLQELPNQALVSTAAQCLSILDNLRVEASSPIKSFAENLLGALQHECKARGAK